MKKNIKKFIKGNKGASEITQSFLLIGVAICLVVTIFLPQTKDILGDTTNGLGTWVKGAAKDMLNISDFKTPNVNS